MGGVDPSYQTMDDATHGRPDRSMNGKRHDSTEYHIGDSIITVERGPAGPVARIERMGQSYTRAYAGPLPEQTLAALREVATRGV